MRTTRMMAVAEPIVGSGLAGIRFARIALLWASATSCGIR
jgi:hypothetical protein